MSSVLYKDDLKQKFKGSKAADQNVLIKSNNPLIERWYHN